MDALAEKEGFEPSRRYTRPTPLAGGVLFAYISAFLDGLGVIGA